MVLDDFPMDIYNKLYFWSLIKMFFGLRVTEEEESDGVDISECGLEAYPEFSKAAGAKTFSLPRAISIS
jgi:hypothetical protein